MYVYVYIYICMCIYIYTVYMRNFACPNYKFMQFKYTAASKCKQNSIEILQEYRSISIHKRKGEEKQVNQSLHFLPYWHRIPTLILLCLHPRIALNMIISRLDAPGLQLYFGPLSADACRALCGLRLSKTKRVGQRSSLPARPQTLRSSAHCHVLL